MAADYLGCSVLDLFTPEERARLQQPYGVTLLRELAYIAGVAELEARADASNR